MLRRPVESALTALVRVMQQGHRLAPAPHGHHQRIHHELRGHALLHRPTHDAPRVQVQHRRHVQPAFCRPDVCEVGNPFLVRAIGLELAVQHVVGHGTARATVLGQSASPWPGTQCLLSHEPFDAVQTTSLTLFQHVVPHTPCPVGAVTAHEALVHMRTQHLVAETTPAPGPCEPGVEAASRDTERLAQQIDRPGPSVFRHEAELHIDSFAK